MWFTVISFFGVFLNVKALGGAVRAENVGGAEMQTARGLSLGVSPSLVGCFLRSVCRWCGSASAPVGAEVVPLLVLSAALRSSSACVGADLVGVRCQQSQKMMQNNACYKVISK